MSLASFHTASGVASFEGMERDLLMRVIQPGQWANPTGSAPVFKPLYLGANPQGFDVVEAEFTLWTGATNGHNLESFIPGYAPGFKFDLWLPGDSTHAAIPGFGSWDAVNNVWVYKNVTIKNASPVESMGQKAPIIPLWGWRFNIRFVASCTFGGNENERGGVAPTFSTTPPVILSQKFVAHQLQDASNTADPLPNVATPVYTGVQHGRWRGMGMIWDHMDVAPLETGINWFRAMHGASFSLTSNQPSGPGQPNTITAWVIGITINRVSGYWEAKIDLATNETSSFPSGGILIYMSTRNAGSGGSSIFAGSEVAFTTADADRVLAPLHGGAWTITYRNGWIDADVTTSQSADASKGQGFLAPAIDAGLSIQDADGLISQDITTGHVNPIGWDIWISYIPANGIWSDVIPLVQLQTVDLKIDKGSIQLVPKSPAYLGNELLYGIRTATQLDTDPVNPSNPTDPTFLRSSVATQFAGVAFGSRAVSLKAGDPLPVETLAYYQHTALQSGDISVLTDPVASIVAKTALNLADGFLTSPSFLPQFLNADGSLDLGATLKFFCRCDSVNPASPDMTEANRLAAEIASFESAGYSIVLSDRNWSLSLDSYTPWNGLLATHAHIPSGGAAYGVSNQAGASSGNPNYAYVWFNINDADGNPLYPTDGLDGSQISIYAVPPSVAISSGQVTLEGFARNDRTTKINGVGAFDGSIQTFQPGMANAEGFVGITPVVAPLAFNAGTAGPHLGAFEDQSSHVTGTSGTVVGSTSAVIVDPAIGWNGGADPITATLTKVQGVGGLAPGNFILRLQLKTTMESFDADFFCADTTFVATITEYLGSFSHPIAILIQGAFEQACNYKSALNAGPAFSLTVQNVADRNRTIPKWQSKFDSLADGNAILAPSLVWNNVSDDLLNCSFIIREIFIWAFTKFGFSQIYSTVYPFWTGGNCANLATDGAGNVLAGGLGIGTVAADGSQNWTSEPFVGPLGTAGVITWTGSAFGAGIFTGFYVTVGYVTPTTGARVPIFQTAAAPLGTTQAFAGTALPTRIRFFGGTTYVCLFDDGTIRTSTDGSTWSSPITTGASILYDIAFDGTNYVAVGPAGHIYKSINLTSWTDVAASGITRIVYGLTWFAAGAVYVAVGANGSTYHATVSQAIAGTWTAVALSTGGQPVEAVASNGVSVVCVSATTTGVKVWGSPDGSSWVLQYSDPDDGMSSSLTAGYNFGVVWTGSVWMIGTSEPNILTSADAQQGSATLLATWIPWGTNTPNQSLANLRARYFGGLRRLVYAATVKNFNPVQWNGNKLYINLQSWGIAFDPPTATVNDYSGTNADAAARKIAQEWWAQAGEMPATVLDGSNDLIDMDFPEIALGNIEDMATIITVQYQPFGGKYLGAAYIQNVNVDRATAGKPDAFFFAGWDSSGNTNGLALWTLCRNVFLKTGILRSTSLTFDSVHDPDTLGTLWTTTDPDLGQRMKWLCGRPQYLKILVHGNESNAAQAYCGCRYKPNAAMLAARGLSALNSTGYGVVVQCDHNFTAGTHSLDIAFPPA